MEEQLREPTAADSWRQALAYRLEERRERARGLLTTERERLKQLEADFSVRIGQLNEQIAAEAREAEQRTCDQDVREALLNERQQTLDEQRSHLQQTREQFEATTGEARQRHQEFLAGIGEQLNQLQSRQSQLEQAERTLHDERAKFQQSERDVARRGAELEKQAAELAQRGQALEQNSAKAVAKREALAAQEAQLQQWQQAHQAAADQLQNDQRELQLAQEQLQRRDQETHKRRRQIAQQLRARKQELTAEIELHRAEALASATGQDLQLQVRLSEVQAKYERLRDDLAGRDQQSEQLTQQIAALNEQLQVRQEELAGKRQLAQELTAQRDQLNAQYQKLSEEFAASRTQAQHDLEAQRQANHAAASQLQADLGEQLGAAQEQLAVAQQQLAHLQSELAKTREQAAQAEAQLAAERKNQAQSGGEAARKLQAEVERLTSEQKQALQQAAAADQRRQEELTALQAELTKLRTQSASSADSVAEVALLHEENQRLEACLKQAEAKANAAPAAGPEHEELRRRFEIAVADVRELKTKNAELCQQLAKAKTAAATGGATASAAGGMDWEAQKKRLLEQLESDFDGNDQDQARDKLTVQGAIRMTDQLVAEKEKEIEELRQLLEHQSDNIGDVAVGASAIAEMFQNDELIQQERENLRQQQQAMQEQLRKAEVDISLERAKLARERADLEEKLRVLSAEQEKANRPTGSGGNKEPDGNKPARGRWLARLGLKEGDRE